MINRKFYFMWRKRGETAKCAAYLARGSEALDNGTVKDCTEYDPEGCQCDFSGDMVKYCHVCKDNRRRQHRSGRVDSRDDRHKHRCAYTLWCRVESADGAYSDSVGGVCVESESDPYLERQAAELSVQVLDQMAPTPSNWLAL